MYLKSVAEREEAICVFCPRTIDEIAWLRHPNHAGPLAMIAAYFDESCDPKKQRFYNIGGFMAEQRHWITFEQSWHRTASYLRDNDLMFHAADCESEVAGFEKLGHDKCVGVMTSMVDSVLSAPLYATNAVVDLPIFKHFFPAFHTEEAWYLLGFYCVVSQVAEWGCSVREPVAVIFDNRPEFETQALRYYRYMQGLEGWDAGKYLGEPGFGTRELYQPLQAADFIARETFKFFYSGHEEPTRAVRIPILRMKDTKRLQAIWWGREQLFALYEYVRTEYGGALNEFFARDLMRPREDQFLTKIRSAGFMQS